MHLFGGTCGWCRPRTNGNARMQKHRKKSARLGGVILLPISHVAARAPTGVRRRCPMAQRAPAPPGARTALASCL
eukprot:4404042-Pleurochrysis_carterae.AAC.1